MKPSRLFAIVGFAVALVMGPVGSGVAQEDGRLAVRGTGEVTVVPDAAEISSGVTTQATTATQALADNSKAMAAVLAGLEAAGVAAADIQTGRFDVSPVFSRPGRDDTEGPRPIGTRVVNQVTVVVRDLERLGVVLDDMVGRGADTVSGLRLFVVDDDAARQAARQAAVADALATAEVLAEAAGVTLGPIVRLSEGGVAVPSPMLEARAFASAVPVAVGEQVITASVEMVFVITP